MQRALQLIVIYGVSIKRVAVPVDITACRISFTFFEIIMGYAHRVSGAIGAGITELWPGGSMAAQGIFYGTDRSAEGIRFRVLLRHKKNPA